MRKRVITAVIALLLFLPIIFFDFGGISVQLLGALLAIIGVYELFRMKGLAMLSFEGVLSAIGAVVLVLPNNPWFSYFPDNTDKLILFYFIVMILLGISVISKNMYTIDEAGFPVLVSLYVGVGFQNFVEARETGLLVLLFGLFIVWATDIGAYMIGRKYGRRKLWPEISPNKSIEGALGGILSAVFIAIVFLIIYPGSLYFEYGSFVMIFWTIIFSMVGQFGDLVESAIKRHYQVKDSGNILPGHGGILDRFDSMLFVFPIMHLIGLF
ncbi:phosphatidate cytidylyltransferase [Tetragenococcus koreensis]|uniref:phosphatidate cytidylyltransferase n=1 Tax=Tetragenococcus koreensis TaxID=290335 RepID=UPI000F4E0B72|nr:phosphatidate cytidylyltransferase [Tetragenococcus koreensis]AYW44680.1 phosphatidate cytidylyltransferase [Tetragenococcus koreensis]MCF1584166.1 phosphatidate cytidylyltransferase [Tetragenococcus koreensis]MCF1613701.1 phosphatidate cytidylyltransferase [Tetragenococcus koreensis]MCF1618976.1 phosphatidate cytidylyltransferase [Tetragenococcus koreensis]MCF1623479.1 phosphatidate cytidylyltransferase [Tetragenococcus koreensis]